MAKLVQNFLGSFSWKERCHGNCWFEELHGNPLQNLIGCSRNNIPFSTNLNIGFRTEFSSRNLRT